VHRRGVHRDLLAQQLDLSFRPVPAFPSEGSYTHAIFDSLSSWAEIQNQRGLFRLTRNLLHVLHSDVLLMPRIGAITMSGYLKSTNSHRV
jgi:hypothetical protein